MGELRTREIIVPEEQCIGLKVFQGKRLGRLHHGLCNDIQAQGSRAVQDSPYCILEGAHLLEVGIWVLLRKPLVRHESCSPQAVLKLHELAPRLVKQRKNTDPLDSSTVLLELTLYLKATNLRL